MPDDCLFCRIIAGEEPATFVGDSEHAVAFRDIFPRAPIHVLVVSRDHLDSIHEVTRAHDEVVGDMLALTRQVAQFEGITDGYRVATNIGRRGGQMIPHLHFHVIGGRQLGHIDSGDEA